MKTDLKERIHNALVDAWGNDQEMVKYCEGKIASAVQLENGMILYEEKQKIETDFCFGWSSCGQGPEYSEAMKSERNARSKEDYFIRENMRVYDEEITHLTKDDGWYPIIRTAYGSQSEKNPLRILQWHRLSFIVDHYGKEALQPGYRTTTSGEWNDLYIPTEEDLKQILTMEQEARAQHEKKVKAYLKRYGLSKLHTWTYWIDD